MEDKFYTCKNDKCHKCVFLNPLNQDLLSLMISEVTGNSYSNITYSNVEKNINMAIRRKYLDIALDSSEAIIGIEVNGFNKNYVRPRNTSFICDSYSNYTLVKGKYTEDKLIMQINYTYGVKSDVAIKEYMILNTDRSDLIPRVKNFIIYEVYMDYVMDFWYNRNKQGINYKNNLDNIIKYRYFIMLSLNLEELEELIELTGDERIVVYMEELKKVNGNPKFREYITDEMDKQFIINTEREEGEKIGEARGEKIGEARGEKIGEKKGELKKQIEIARNSLRAKLSLETISQITGLSISQIKNISL